MDDSTQFDPTQPVSPDIAQRKLDLSVMLPAKQDLLKQQMARVAALRGQKVPQPASYGWGGGLAAGLAGGINDLSAGMRERALDKQAMGLANQKAVDTAAIAGPQQPMITPDQLQLMMQGPSNSALLPQNEMYGAGAKPGMDVGAGFGAVPPDAFNPAVPPSPFGLG